MIGQITAFLGLTPSTAEKAPRGPEPTSPEFAEILAEISGQVKQDGADDGLDAQRADTEEDTVQDSENAERSEAESVDEGGLDNTEPTEDRDSVLGTRVTEISDEKHKNKLPSDNTTPVQTKSDTDEAALAPDKKDRHVEQSRSSPTTGIDSNVSSRVGGHAAASESRAPGAATKPGQTSVSVSDTTRLRAGTPLSLDLPHSPLDVSRFSPDRSQLNDPPSLSTDAPALAKNFQADHGRSESDAKRPEALSARVRSKPLANIPASSMSNVASRPAEAQGLQPRVVADDAVRESSRPAPTDAKEKREHALAARLSYRVPNSQLKNVRQVDATHSTDASPEKRVARLDASESFQNGKAVRANVAVGSAIPKSPTQPIGLATAEKLASGPTFNAIGDLSGATVADKFPGVFSTDRVSSSHSGTAQPTSLTSELATKVGPSGREGAAAQAVQAGLFEKLGRDVALSGAGISPADLDSATVQVGSAASSPHAKESIEKGPLSPNTQILASDRTQSEPAERHVAGAEKVRQRADANADIWQIEPKAVHAMPSTGQQVEGKVRVSDDGVAQLSRPDAILEREVRHSEDKTPKTQNFDGARAASSQPKITPPRQATTSINGMFAPEAGLRAGLLDDERHLAENEVSVAVSSELRAGPSGHTAVPTGSSVYHRPEAQAILRQIAESLPRLSEFGIEIRLSPEELGPVRMHLLQSDTGLLVHVHADRPETLDLLRRNIEQLSRDLADAGHNASGFTFSDGEGRQSSGGSSSSLSAERIGTQAEGADEIENVTHNPTSDGVDIRI